MKTTLIVDGYNAINAIPEVKKRLKESLLTARSAIIVITKEFVRSSGYITDFCVVFDGQDRYRYLDTMGIPRERGQVFSKTGEGDEKIIDTVRRYSEKDRVIVASNDNYVKNMSRGYGAALMNSEDLVKKKPARPEIKDKPPEKKISKELKDEITEEYMKELGL